LTWPKSHCGAIILWGYREPTAKLESWEETEGYSVDTSGKFWRIRGYVLALAAVALTTGLAFPLLEVLPHASLLLLFLTCVLLVSSRSGLGPALLASLLSFLAINYFFTEPVLTLRVHDDGDITTLLFFLLIATITGNLAARMHREIAERKASLLRISGLYEFSRKLSSAGNEQAVQQELAGHIAGTLGCPACVVPAAAGTEQGAVDLKVTVWGNLRLPAEAFSQARAEIPGVSDFWASIKSTPGIAWLGGWNVFRLTTAGRIAGYVLLHGPKLPVEQAMEVQSLCDQAALALDRIRLVADLEQERINSETEQLRSALLSSVSHDLRTPLASIIGSSSTLLELQASLKPEDSRELLATIDQEARRLDSYIQNLLDMTRLGQGGLKLRRDWVDLNDLVSNAATRLSGRLDRQRLQVSIPADFPLLWLHGVLVEQAFFNLLDNASRYAPAGSLVRVQAEVAGTNAIIRICDEGPGVPPEEREKIFDMFYTVAQGDRSHYQGTGLGLAICRGMIAAHGGEVDAEDGINGVGTCMRVSLPIHPQPAEGAMS
jgi:two-component system sensor histidine kinase KdpD